MTINIPHPDCPSCNPKCPCCGTPIRTAPRPTINPEPIQPFGPWTQPTYPVPFNPYPHWWDGFTYGYGSVTAGGAEPLGMVACYTTGGDS